MREGHARGDHVTLTRESQQHPEAEQQCRGSLVALRTTYTYSVANLNSLSGVDISIFYLANHI